MTLLSRRELLVDEPDIHRRLIGAILTQHPKWLHSGSLLDNVWVVEAPRRQKRRGQTIELDFNFVIAPNGELLTNGHHNADLATFKLICFHRLRDSWEAATVKSGLASMAWLLRWRLDRGVYSMRDLTFPLYQDYLARLIRGGRCGLVDFESRLDLLKAAVRAGAQSIPTLAKSHPDMPAVVQLLGVQRSNSLPRHVHHDLLRFLKSMGYRLKPRSEALLKAPRRDLSEAGGMSQASAMSALLPWYFLKEFTSELQHDPIGFDPFAIHSLEDQVRARARPDERTENIPAEQACHLVDRALRWVFDYSRPLLAMVRECENLLRLPLDERKPLFSALVEAHPIAGPGAPRIYPGDFEKVGRAKTSGAISLRHAAFHLLPTACATVIHTFSARRKEEVDVLKDDCLVRDDCGRPHLDVWIEKTLRDFDKIPVPESVARAIEVLLCLSAPARHQRQSAWLFDFVIPASRRAVYFQFGSSLNAFASFVDAPLLADGTAWRFTPHQFRRFFSVIYMHHYQYASLTALSAFLRHFSESMTRHYVTEVCKGVHARTRELARIATRDAVEHSGLPDDVIPTRRMNWRFGLRQAAPPQLAHLYDGILDSSQAARRRNSTLPVDFDKTVRAARSAVRLLEAHMPPSAGALNSELDEVLKGAGSPLRPLLGRSEKA